MDLVKQLAGTEQKAIGEAGSLHKVQPFATLDTKTADVDGLVSGATCQVVRSLSWEASKYREACSKEEQWENRFDSGHLPTKCDKPRICKVCSVMLAVYSTDSSKRPKRSMFACMKCDIPLCIGERNCFALFHSQEFDEYKDSYIEHCRRN